MNTSIGQIVLQHRKLAGLTQRELADLAGVGKTVVFDLEHDKQSIQLDTLSKILKVLNIQIQLVSPLLERLQRNASEPPGEKEP